MDLTDRQKQIKNLIHEYNEGWHSEESLEKKLEDLFLEKTIKKIKVNLDFDQLLKFINLQTGRKFRIITDSVKRKYRARIKEGYTIEDIQHAISNASKIIYHIETGNQYLTPEFFSRSAIIDKYSSKAIIKSNGQDEIKRASNAVEDFLNS